MTYCTFIWPRVASVKTAARNGQWTWGTIGWPRPLAPSPSPLPWLRAWQHLRPANRQLLGVPRYCLNTYSLFSRRPHSLELSQISSGSRLSMQTVSDVCLKRTCSLDTTAFSTFEFLTITTLHKKLLKLRWLPVTPIENLCMVYGEAVEEAFK